jgi:hypothetical protein
VPQKCGEKCAKIAAESAERGPTFKTGVSDVRVDVQVTDGNKLIKDLTKERLRGGR